jgi:hypothetical protein
MSLPVSFTFLYNALTVRARELGYALTLHGSMNRDLDIVAVPWSDDAAPATSLVDAMVKASYGIIAPHEQPDLPYRRPHGRLCWPIRLVGGHYIDLSVMPLTGGTP